MTALLSSDMLSIYMDPANVIVAAGRMSIFWLLFGEAGARVRLSGDYMKSGATMHDIMS